MPLTIGIEASPLGYPAGGGLWTFLHYAIRELARLDPGHQWRLYTTQATTSEMVPVSVGDGSRWRMRRARGPSAIRPSLWLQAGFRRAMARDGLDVLWLTRHVPPLTVRTVPLVATVFDVLYHHVPDALSLSLRTSNRFFLKALAHRAQRFIATSHATARDASSVLGVDPARIDVAYGGVDADRFFVRDAREARDRIRRADGVERPYVLALEVYAGRKNFVTMLEAYRLLPADVRRAFPVLATGRPVRHARNVDVEGAVRRLGLVNDVRIVDHVPYHEMPWLYSGAALLAFVSRYEGFGLPIVEAMACGCPVLTGDWSSMPEAGGEAALYASPDDPAAIARQMERALTDDALGTELRARGIERAKAFTWSRYAEAVLHACETAVMEAR